MMSVSHWLKSLGWDGVNTNCTYFGLSSDTKYLSKEFLHSHGRTTSLRSLLAHNAHTRRQLHSGLSPSSCRSYLFDLSLKQKMRDHCVTPFGYCSKACMHLPYVRANSECVCLVARSSTTDDDSKDYSLIRIEMYANFKSSYLNSTAILGWCF